MPPPGDPSPGAVASDSGLAPPIRAGSVGIDTGGRGSEGRGCEGSDGFGSTNGAEGLPRGGVSILDPGGAAVKEKLQLPCWSQPQLDR